MKEKEGFIEELRKIFVTIDIFNITEETVDRRLSTIEKIFFTIISAIGLAVLGAWMNYILKKP